MNQVERNQLYFHNEQTLEKMIVKKYYWLTNSLDDIIQIGKLHMWEATGNVKDKNTQNTYIIKCGLSAATTEVLRMLSDYGSSGNAYLKTAIWLKRNNMKTNMQDLYSKYYDEMITTYCKPLSYKNFISAFNRINLMSSDDESTTELIGQIVDIDDILNPIHHISMQKNILTILSYVKTISNTRDFRLYQTWMSKQLGYANKTLKSVSDEMGITKQRATSIVQKINEKVAIQYKNEEWI